MKRINQYEAAKPIVDGIRLKEFQNYDVGFTQAYGACLGCQRGKSWNGY